MQGQFLWTWGRALIFMDQATCRPCTSWTFIASLVSTLITLRLWGHTKRSSRSLQKSSTEYLSAYHWMNVGVESNRQSSLNPLQMLADNYNKDDFIVVKLDIDTSSIKVPLVYQLVQDECFVGLVDHFYFEHHVYLQELAPWWNSSMNGTASESLCLF